MPAWKESDDYAQDDLAPEDVLRAQRRRLYLVLTGVALAVTAWCGWWWFLRDPQHLLTESRALLSLAVEADQPRERLDKSRRAEILLDRYLGSAGREKMSARALLLAARILQGKPLVTENSSEPFNPSECATSDLNTAVAGLMASGEVGLADRLISESLRRKEDRLRTLRLAMQIRYQLGLELHALAHCRELTQLAPNDPQPWLTMALIYERGSDWNAILPPLRKYLALAPRHAGYYRLQLVGYLIKTRAIEEARREFDRVYAEEPDAVRRDGLTEARLLHGEGKLEQALQVLRRLPDRDGVEGAAAAELEGRILVAQMRYADAVPVLTAAIQLDPLNHEAHFLLGTAYGRLGDAQQSQHHLARSQELLGAKKEMHKLERTAGREPANVAVRLKLAELCASLGWQELQQQWLTAAEVAGDGGSP